MRTVRPAVLGVLLTLTCLSVGCASSTEDTDAQDNAAALAATGPAACSDIDLERQYPSLRSSVNSRRFNEIGARAHGIIVDLAGLLGEHVTGAARCDDRITKRTSDVVNRAACLHRALDAASDVKVLMAGSPYTSSQAEMDDAFAAASKIATIDSPLKTVECRDLGKVDYLETLEASRVNFGLVRTFDGFEYTGK